MTEQIAIALLKMTWEEMDELAAYVVSVARDEDGNPNDERFVAQCMIDKARETLEDAIQ